MGEMDRLRQSLQAAEEAAAARKEAVRMELERSRLQQEVDLQVGRWEGGRRGMTV